MESNYKNDNMKGLASPYLHYLWLVDHHAVIFGTTISIIWKLWECKQEE